MRMICANGDEPSRLVAVDDYRSDLLDRSNGQMVLIPDEARSSAAGVLGMDAFVSGRIEFECVDRRLTIWPSMPEPAGFLVQPGGVCLGSVIVVDVVLFFMLFETQSTRRSLKPGQHVHVRRHARHVSDRSGAAARSLS
jgi:hypothetical protein